MDSTEAGVSIILWGQPIKITIQSGGGGRKGFDQKTYICSTAHKLTHNNLL